MYYGGMETQFLSCLNPTGYHNMAYTVWGAGHHHKPPLICVHGVTRNGRDFDWLAQGLQKDRAVFCPDIVGRGRSDWLPQEEYYNHRQYESDLSMLMAHIGGESFDWVGSSMGGFLGMLIASMPGNKIRRLVLNDIGPEMAVATIQRIGKHIGMMPEFVDLKSAERYMRQIYAPFGIKRDEDWQLMAENGCRVLQNGHFMLAYDPLIAKFFVRGDRPTDLWGFYDKITCPTLVLRGGQSSILTPEVAEAMTARGPRAELVTLDGVGHTPALIDADQIKIIQDFLDK